MSAMDAAERSVEVGQLILRSDGIIHTVLDFSGPSTIGTADELLAARAELVGDRTVPVIVEIISILHTSRSIRKRFMRAVPDPVCRAVVTPNLAYRTLFKMFRAPDTAAVSQQGVQSDRRGGGMDPRRIH